MKNQLAPLLLLATLFCTSTRADELSVLIVTGGHRYDEPEFAQMLKSLDDVQCDFVLTERMQAMPSAAIIEKYDALVFLDMVKEKVAAGAKKQYTDLSQAGVGMVFLHFTLASRPFWDGYHEMVGGKFYLPKIEKDPRLHSTYTTDLTVKAKVLDPAHPVTEGLSDFTITDAFYGNIAVSSSIKRLLASGHSETAETIAWTHTHGQSKVVYLMPGFTKQAYNNPAYRRFIKNAIVFVAR